MVLVAFAFGVSYDLVVDIVYGILRHNFGNMSLLGYPFRTFKTSYIAGSKYIFLWSVHTAITINQYISIHR